MTELSSHRFCPITTTLWPKVEGERMEKISSPVSVSYEKNQEKRKLTVYFPEGFSGKGVCCVYGSKERRENV